MSQGGSRQSRNRPKVAQRGPRSRSPEELGRLWSCCVDPGRLHNITERCCGPLLGNCGRPEEPSWVAPGGAGEPRQPSKRPGMLPHKLRRPWSAAKLPPQAADEALSGANIVMLMAQAVPRGRRPAPRAAAVAQRMPVLSCFSILSKTIPILIR